MKVDSQKLLIRLADWAARALVLAVFVLWGGFFVEHLREWFVTPFPEYLPMKVWGFQTLHLMLLLGLLVSLRWTRLGVIWVTLAAVALFLPLAGSRGLAFVALTLLPVLLLALLKRWKSATPPIPRQAP